MHDGAVLAETGQETSETVPETPENPAEKPRNKGGRPKGAKTLKVTGWLRHDLETTFNAEAARSGARVIRAYFDRAVKGDTRAGQDILTRMIGPAPQRVEVSGPGGSPVAVQQLAPVALALMSTEQLAALAAFHRGLGLLPAAAAIDAQTVSEDAGGGVQVEVEPPPIVESGPLESSPVLSPLSPVSLVSEPASADSASQPQPASRDHTQAPDQADQTAGQDQDKGRR